MNYKIGDRVNLGSREFPDFATIETLTDKRVLVSWDEGPGGIVLPRDMLEWLEVATGAMTGDVPSLNAGLDPHNRRRQTPRGGGHKHPVTLGHHDATIVPMAHSGERIITIASELDCTDSLVARRLRVLGVEWWR